MIAAVVVFSSYMFNVAFVSLLNLCELSLEYDIVSMMIFGM